MSLKSFTEKEVNNKIINKVGPKVISKGKHWKCGIYLGDKLVGKVKVPNSHKRLFHASKAQYVAKDLGLTDEQYNQLIECSLTSTGYYKIAKENEEKREAEEKENLKKKK